MLRTKPLLAVLLIALFASPAARAESDWEIYMLRLVNRARMDPAGEPARLQSTVRDPQPPMSPLAYNDIVAKCAAGHDQWMLDNLGKLPDAKGSPDSFSHFETLTGEDGGAAAKQTQGFTGVDIGQRMKAAGLMYRMCAENITVAYSTERRDYPVDRKIVEMFHKGWWESEGHRHNLLNGSFRLFGTAIHRGNIAEETATAAKLDHPYTVIIFGTQNFAQPRERSNFITGLVYADLDKSGDWTPHDPGPKREGQADIAITVIDPSSGKTIAQTKTTESGAFNVAVPDGTYRVVAKLANEERKVEKVKVAGGNAVVPDIEIGAAKPR